MEERFFHLLKKRLTGLANLQEEEELNKLIDQHEDLKQLYSSLFQKQAVPDEKDLLETEQAYAAHSVKMQLNTLFNAEEKISEPVVVKHRPNRWYLSAAVVILGLGIGCISYLYFNRPATPIVQNNEVATRKGSKSRIILPDSTIVWLNADSKIIYPGNFAKESREVTLTGEAFFEVTKDAKRPFTIHANTIDVKVLGTVFNVRSYPEENTTETSLLRGEVEVTVLNQGKKVILKPNEKLIVPNKIDTAVFTSDKPRQIKNVEEPLLRVDKIHFKENDSLYTETCWIDNKLNFDAEQLDRVASKLERWYNVEVIINNEKIKSTRFTATFEKESLNQVLEALSISYSFKYKIEKGKVILY